MSMLLQIAYYISINPQQNSENYITMNCHMLFA